MKRYGWVTLIVVGIALVAGCPEQGADRPKTVPVSGTVTYNDAPVEGATVTFVPSGSGKAATGITDASGKYTLGTFASDDGAVPGSYGVKIVKFKSAPRADDGVEDMDSEAYDAAQQAGGAEEPAEAENELPEKYADPKTSGFEATVAEGQTDPVDFALTD